MMVENEPDARKIGGRHPQIRESGLFPQIIKQGVGGESRGSEMIEGLEARAGAPGSHAGAFAVYCDACNPGEVVNEAR